MKQRNVVSLLSLLWSTFLLLSAASRHGVEAVKEFKVGDDFGWQEPGNNSTSVCSQWAGKNRFHVGDSLSLEYKNDRSLMGILPLQHKQSHHSLQQWQEFDEA